MATRANRSDLPTPGWRMLHRTELKSMVRAKEMHLSDDSEDDETFIRSNQTISTEERERWAGFSIKKQSAATKGSQSRSKRSRGGKPRTMDAVFPTPMESFLLVHQAKTLYLEHQRNLTPGDEASKSAEMRQNLANFMDSLETFAAIESCLQKQKANMSRLLAARNANGNTRVDSSAGKLPNGTASIVDAGMVAESPFKRQRRNSSAVSGPNENFLLSSATTMPAALSRDRGSAKQALDIAIMELAVTRLDLIEKSFLDNSSTLFNALRDLLEQADLKAPSSRSFTSLMKQFRDASSAAAHQNGSSQKAHRLSEIIKSQIDSGRYPVIAQTFKLSESYRLDGCDPRKIWEDEARSLGSVNGVHKKGEKSESTPEPQPEKTNASSSKDKLKSFGFSLDAHLLDSDEEDDDAIINPLHGEAWHDVRMRLERKRKRSAMRRKQGSTDVDDGLPLLPVAPNVEINISVHSTPSSIAEKHIDHLHPGDRALLDDDPIQGDIGNSVVRRIVEFQADDDDLIPLPDDEQVPPEDVHIVHPNGLSVVSGDMDSPSTADQSMENGPDEVEQPYAAKSSLGAQGTRESEDTGQTIPENEAQGSNSAQQVQQHSQRQNGTSAVKKSPQPTVAPDKRPAMKETTLVGVETVQESVNAVQPMSSRTNGYFAEEEVLDSNDAYHMQNATAKDQPERFSSHNTSKDLATCHDESVSRENRLEEDVHLKTKKPTANGHAQVNGTPSPLIRNTTCVPNGIDPEADGVSSD